MSKIKWEKLISGTDVRGKAIAAEGEEANLTENAAEGIGFSFVKWLEDNLNKESREIKLAIGHDSRLSADSLKFALARGMKLAGADVYSTGLASTPAMFMSTVLEGHQYDGSIMITASHLPYDKNGFKFFTRNGGLEKENVLEILAIAAEKEDHFFKKELPAIDPLNKIDLISDYAEHIKTVIRENLSSEVDQKQPLADFKIVVDAGNGSGGFFVEKILEELGADTEGSQFLEPDGNFPNHAPNPEDKEAMHSIQKAVLENDADLGIIFDTDVDRAAVVDSSGQEINRNKLIALAATIVLENNPGATIVTDSVTSVGLKEFIENKLGGVHHRFKRGYKNVINEAKRLETEGITAPLAIETSGHAAFKENYFLDDGAYLVAKVLIKMANLKVEENRKIGDLIADLKEANIKEEYRMTIQLNEFKEYGQQILADLKEFIKEIDEWEIAPKNYQGVRVNCGGNDWFLLRLSLHDPVVVLNVECDKKESLASILKKIKEFLSNYNKLKLDALNQ
ncbi:phosphomannomutase [Halanaerobium saccharolyticum]|uniref:Phosphomannomutase n=1 Tax=Halanaerobium saccharolyticum TaxID=43595 RepID=A0A4V6PTJ6_9FIRM|nr:phosphomannomutase/phosphoglucomutase [Halanaerobium saccharolyticum]TDO83503.1 phosphomannomutase [Halanaerobium saccharolyticum]